MRMWSPRRINLQKIAGLKTLIGLDINEQRVRAVELKILGGTVDKFNSRFTVSKYLTYDIVEGSSFESSAGAIKEELKRRGMRSHYAVAAIETGKVKVVRAEVPSDITNFDEWLQDNFDKLVRIPVPFQELAYQYETVKARPSNDNVEIAFVRTSDVDSIIQVVKSMGLDLIALSAGVRDCITPLFLSDSYKLEGRVSFVFGGEGYAAMFDIEDGRVVGSYSSRSVADLPVREGGNTLLAGEVLGSGCSRFSPFGIPGEYALAAGLAVRGFLPELQSAEFLPSSEKLAVMERLSKRLFQRVVLACGGILLVALLIQSIFTMYVDHAENKVDARLLQSGASWSEVTVLEKQNARLKNELAMIEADSARSNVAKLLHDIVRIVPEGVWLYKMVLTKDRPIQAGIFAKPRPRQGKDSYQAMSGYIFLVSGYSDDSKRIAEFVRLFGKEPDLQDVRIVRSGFPVYGENMTAVGKKLATPLTFTISLVPKVR